MSNVRNLLFNPPIGGEWKILHGKKLLIAFSGGKDSLALLHYLVKHKDAMGSELCAAHINHHLRGAEARRDERFCRGWCEKNGVKYVSLEADVLNMPSAKGRGVEFSAREARYGLLEEARRRLNCDFILTAHTLDDQLESFFVDLITGASLYTIGGVEALHERIVRPMLNISTAMVQEYIEAMGLKPVYDSSNGDLGYVRNRVRHTLIGLVRDMAPTVLRIQEESRGLNVWLDERTRQAARACDGCVIIDRVVFDGFAIPEKHYLLGKWVSALCRGGKIHVDAVMAQCVRNGSKRLNMPEHYLCEVTPTEIRLFPASMVAPFSFVKAVGESSATLNGRTVNFPAELVDKELIVRSRKDGDRYQGKKLKNLYSDRKIPLFDRDRAMILEYNGEILWAEYI